MLQNGDAGRTTVHRDKWKGKLDVGDIVYLAVHYSEPAHKSLMGLDGRKSCPLTANGSGFPQAMTIGKPMYTESIFVR